MAGFLETNLMRFRVGFRRTFEFARKLKLPLAVPDVIAAPGDQIALFFDEDEQEALYVHPWPYHGVPICPSTNRSEWQIEGHLFSPSRRDPDGTWIFRRTK